MRNDLKTWLTNGVGKKILLLRHGAVQVEKKNEKHFIGQMDLPLSDKGRRQAQYWLEWLAEVPIARIIASDLSRSMETARIIAAGRSLEVTPVAGLREIHLGQWDGMSFRQVNERWPNALRKRGMEMDRYRPPGGESFLDLQQRVVPVLEKGIEQISGNILMVAHAGVNRVILCHLLGMPLQNLFRIAQGCGAMNLIDRQNHGYRIQSLNLLPVGCGVDSTTR